MVKVEFKEVIEQSHRLLMPVVAAIGEEMAFEMKWDKEKKEWFKEELTGRTVSSLYLLCRMRNCIDNLWKIIENYS